MVLPALPTMVAQQRLSQTLIPERNTRKLIVDECHPAENRQSTIHAVLPSGFAIAAAKLGQQSIIAYFGCRDRPI